MKRFWRWNVQGVDYDTDDQTLDALTSSEIMELEATTGMTCREWLVDLNRGGLRGLTALVWLERRKRGEPDLALPAVRFTLGEVKAEIVEVPEPEDDDAPPQEASLDPRNGLGAPEPEPESDDDDEDRSSESSEPTT